MSNITAALRRLGQLSQTHAWRYAAATHLTPTQQRVLDVLLRRSQGLGLSMLARELGISTATASDCVNTLQAKKLAQKTPAPFDARQVIVHLTSAGTAVATSLASLPDPLHPGLMTLEDFERRLLFRYLIKVIRAFEQFGTLAVSRMCLRCQFFDPSREVDSPSPHYCRAHREFLSDLEIKTDCPDFEDAGSESEELLWARFETGFGMPRSEAVRELPSWNHASAEVDS